MQNATTDFTGSLDSRYPNELSNRYFLRNCRAFSRKEERSFEVTTKYTVTTSLPALRRCPKRPKVDRLMGQAADLWVNGSGRAFGGEVASWV